VKKMAAIKCGNPRQDAGNKGNSKAPDSASHLKESPADILAPMKIQSEQAVVESVFSTLRDFFRREYSKPGDGGKTLNSTEALLEEVKVSGKYVDSKGVERGYALPKEYVLYAIEYPMFYRTMSATPMFTFALGLGRTAHDPMTGSVNHFWNIGTGPVTTDSNRREWDQRFPQSSPIYWGDDITSWARFHVLMQSGKPPIMCMSALQNERLQPGSETIDEFRRLYQESNSRWKSHYKRIRDAIIGESSSDVDFFAYPNRCAIPPLSALSMASAIGAGEFRIQRPPAGHSASYHLAYDLLKTNRLGIKVDVTDELDSSA
jgi:hypothetical protein